MSEQFDPRFLGGESAVLTDVSAMAWVVAVGWDGAVDMHSNVDKPTMAAQMRHILSHLEADSGESCDV